MEISFEDGFIELSIVWVVKLELVPLDTMVLVDKLGELTFEVDVSADVEDSGRVVVLEAKTDEP